MRTRLLTLLVVSLAFLPTLHAKFVPTPESAPQFAIGKDATKWNPVFQNGNESSILLEFVPEGDSIEAWKEMVAVQIAFTKAPLRRMVDIWRAGLVRADPKIEMEEVVNADGSIVVIYTSLAAKEMSVRRFIQGGDGVYMLAYHVRRSSKTSSAWPFGERSSMEQALFLILN